MQRADYVLPDRIQGDIFDAVHDYSGRREDAIEQVVSNLLNLHKIPICVGYYIKRNKIVLTGSVYGINVAKRRLR